VLTDNGSCFTPRFARACAELGAAYRHTRPRSPHTNGMVERFNGRVGGEVLGITIWSHRDLERRLRGFNAAYNARRQRVLGGKTPDQVVAERLKARRRLANPRPHGRAGPADVSAARVIAEAAKDVSQPDTAASRLPPSRWPWRPRMSPGRRDSAPRSAAAPPPSRPAANPMGQRKLGRRTLQARPPSPPALVEGSPGGGHG
jgi:hypothetical protein